MNIYIVIPFLLTPYNPVIGRHVKKVEINLLTVNQNITTDKSILRYGFHKTRDCHEFAKAFLCVQKCIDLKYDIAHADKQCKCTCYSNRIKAKYTPVRNYTLARWKSGAPTTSLPAWAQINVKKNEKEISGQSGSGENSAEQTDAGVSNTTNISIDENSTGTTTVVSQSNTNSAEGQTGGTSANEKDTGAEAATGRSLTGESQTGISETQAPAVPGSETPAGGVVTTGAHSGDTTTSSAA